MTEPLQKNKASQRSTAVGTAVAFTPAVMAMQESLGSRDQMQRLSDSGRWDQDIGPDLKSFIEAQNSFFVATASRDGRPHIQHRGGQRGFLRVEGPRQLAWTEVPGNRQYITFGNLSENDRTTIFLIDYATQTRFKIWGRAELLLSECPASVVRMSVEAIDRNCKRNVPELWPTSAVQRATKKLSNELTAAQVKIANLEAQLLDRSLT